MSRKRSRTIADNSCTCQKSGCRPRISKYMSLCQKLQRAVSLESDGIQEDLAPERPCSLKHWRLLRIRSQRPSESRSGCSHTAQERARLKEAAHCQLLTPTSRF